MNANSSTLSRITAAAMFLAASLMTKPLAMLVHARVFFIFSFTRLMIRHCDMLTAGYHP